MRQIEITRPASENWTPAALLLRYARENADAGYKYGEYGKLFLRLGKDFYEYNGYHIEPADGKNERIIVHLKEIELQNRR